MSLDASTSTVGIAIFEYDYINDQSVNIKLIHSEYHKPNKKTLRELEWLHESEQYIMEIARSFSIDEFAIEEYIKFMKGGSGASTILPLAIWNRTLCLSIYKQYNYYPNIINVMKIRHALKFGDDLPSKNDIPELVAKHLNINFPYIYKTDRKTKEQKIADESFDVADAIAVGLTYLKIKSSLLKAASSPKKKSKSVKNKKKAKK